MWRDRGIKYKEDKLCPHRTNIKLTGQPLKCYSCKVQGQDASWEKCEKSQVILNCSKNIFDSCESVYQVGLDLSREGLQCLPTNVIHRKLQNYLVLVAYV